MQCTVGYHTIKTLVVDTGSHYNQLTVCLGQSAWKTTEILKNVKLWGEKITQSHTTTINCSVRSVSLVLVNKVIHINE